jgi:NhaP-type Na+/H+ or K+/H+ antiporter
MFGILGLIFAVAAPFLVYRAAKQNGHNALLWTLFAFAAGLGLQIVVPLLIGVILGIVLISSDDTEQAAHNAILGLAEVVGIVCLFLRFAGVLLIMRHVNKVSEEKPFVLPPQPPRNFNR